MQKIIRKKFLKKYSFLEMSLLEYSRKSVDFSIFSKHSSRSKAQSLKEECFLQTPIVLEQNSKTMVPYSWNKLLKNQFKNIQLVSYSFPHFVTEFFPKRKKWIQYWIFPLVGFVSLTWNPKQHFPCFFETRTNSFATSLGAFRTPGSLAPIFISSNNFRSNSGFYNKMKGAKAQIENYSITTNYSKISINSKKTFDFETLNHKNNEKMKKLNNFYFGFLQKRVFSKRKVENFSNEVRNLFWFNNHNFMETFNLSIIENKIPKVKPFIFNEKCSLKILPIFLQTDFTNSNKLSLDLKKKNPISFYNNGENLLQNHFKTNKKFSGKNISFFDNLKKQEKFLSKNLLNINAQFWGSKSDYSTENFINIDVLSSSKNNKKSANDNQFKTIHQSQQNKNPFLYLHLLNREIHLQKSKNHFNKKKSLNSKSIKLTKNFRPEHNVNPVRIGIEILMNTSLRSKVRKLKKESGAYTFKTILPQIDESLFLQKIKILDQKTEKVVKNKLKKNLKLFSILYNLNLNYLLLLKDTSKLHKVSINNTEDKMSIFSESNYTQRLIQKNHNFFEKENVKSNSNTQITKNSVHFLPTKFLKNERVHTFANSKLNAHRAFTNNQTNKKRFLFYFIQFKNLKNKIKKFHNFNGDTFRNFISRAHVSSRGIKNFHYKFSIMNNLLNNLALKNSRNWREKHKKPLFYSSFIDSHALNRTLPKNFDYFMNKNYFTKQNKVTFLNKAFIKSGLFFDSFHFSPLNKNFIFLISRNSINRNKNMNNKNSKITNFRALFLRSKNSAPKVFNNHSKNDPFSKKFENKKVSHLWNNTNYIVIENFLKKFFSFFDFCYAKNPSNYFIDSISHQSFNLREKMSSAFFAQQKSTKADLTNYIIQKDSRKKSITLTKKYLNNKFTQSSIFKKEKIFRTLLSSKTFFIDGLDIHSLNDQKFSISSNRFSQIKAFSSLPLKQKRLLFVTLLKSLKIRSENKKRISKNSFLWNKLQTSNQYKKKFEPSFMKLSFDSTILSSIFSYNKFTKAQKDSIFKASKLDKLKTRSMFQKISLSKNSKSRKNISLNSIIQKLGFIFYPNSFYFVELNRNLKEKNRNNFVQNLHTNKYSSRAKALTNETRGRNLSNESLTKICASEKKEVLKKRTYAEAQKYFQKKRRKKKLKLENRRRKKRKRFYPRPIWLRYNLYRTFLNNRYNKKFGNFQSFQSFLKFQPSFSNLTKEMSNRLFVEKFSFNTKRNFDRSNYNITKMKKIKKFHKKFDLLKNHKKEKFKSFILRNNKEKWGNFLLDTLQIEKNGLKKCLLASSIPVYLNQNNYKISNQILNDFMPLYWKSYWLRHHLNPYMKRIRKNLNNQKIIAFQQENMSFFYNEKFLGNFLGIFSLNLLNSKTLSVPIFADDKSQTPKNVERTNFNSNTKESSRQKRHAANETCFIEFPQQIYKKVFFENTPISFYSNKKTAFYLMNDFYFSQFHLIENMRLIREHNRILFDRISEIIKNIKSNINVDGQNSIKSYKLPKSKYNLVNSSPKTNQTNSLLNTLKSSMFQQLDPNFSFFSLFNFASVQINPKMSNGSNVSSSSIFKPFNSNATLRVLWSFNKTNIFSFKEKNSIKNLWETYKNREQSKSNQTKKFLKKITLKIENNFISTGPKTLPYKIPSIKFYLKKSNVKVQNSSFEFSKNLRYKKLENFYTKNFSYFHNISFKKFRNIQKKLFSSWNITNKKIFYRKNFQYSYGVLGSKKSKIVFPLRNYFNNNNIFAKRTLKTYEALPKNIFPSNHYFQKSNLKKSSIFFWWSNKTFQVPFCFSFKNNFLPYPVGVSHSFAPKFDNSKIESHNSINQQKWSAFLLEPSMNLLVKDNFIYNIIHDNNKPKVNSFSGVSSDSSGKLDSRFTRYSSIFIGQNSKKSSLSGMPYYIVEGKNESAQQKVSTPRLNFDFLETNSIKEKFIVGFSIFFHLCVFLSFLSILELRNLFKFQIFFIYKIFHIYFISLFSFYESIQNIKNKLKKSLKRIGSLPTFYGFFYKNFRPYGTNSLPKISSAFTKKNVQNSFFKRIFEFAPRALSAIAPDAQSASQKMRSNSLTRAVKHHESVFFVFNDFKIYSFNILKSSILLFQRSSSKRLLLNPFATSKKDYFSIQQIVKLLFTETNKNIVLTKNLSKKMATRLSSQIALWSPIKRAKLYARNQNTFENGDKYLKGENFRPVGIRKSIFLWNKITQLKNFSFINLSITFFAKFFVILGLQSIQLSYKVILQIISFLESFLLLIYKFLEKPADLMIESIAQIFLIEWMSNIYTFIPESLDQNIWQSFQKWIRPTRIFGLFFPHFSSMIPMNFTLSEILSISKPESIKTYASLIHKTDFKTSNYIAAIYSIPQRANEIKAWNLSSSFHNSVENTEIFHTLLGKNSVFPYIKLDAFQLTSLSFSFVFIHSFSRIFFKWWDSLLKPDMDLYSRQKKGIYFMNIWGEIFIQAAEKYQMNVASLSTNNLEQEKFMERLLKDPQIFSEKSISPFDLVTKLQVQRQPSNFYQNSRKKKQTNLSLYSWSFRSDLEYKKHEGRFSINWKERSRNSNSSGVHKALTKDRAPTFFDTKVREPFSVQQHIIASCFGGQSTESDLFLDISPPKSFQSIYSFFPQSGTPVSFIVGPILCEVYSGLFSKKVSKNILLITKKEKINQKNTKAGNFFIQALAGETEMKLMIDNAKRYAAQFHNKAIGMRLLKDVFMSIALQTPSFFLMEDIHFIGEKRGMLIGNIAEENSKFDSINLEQDEVHFQNQSIYQLSRHKILASKKWFLDSSVKIDSTNFLLNNKNVSKTFGSQLIDSKNETFDWTFSSNGLLNKSKKQKKHPLPLSFIDKILQNPSGSQESDVVILEKKMLKITPDTFANKRKESLLNNFNNKVQIISRLEKKAEELFAPPSTSPFTILLMKNQKKTKTKKTHFLSWTNINRNQNQHKESENSLSFHNSIRMKIAELADITLRNFSISLDMITDLLVIVDSVRSNRGFIVFATTPIPAVLDPALRRPGRFDETLCLPEFSMLQSNLSFNSRVENQLFFLQNKMNSNFSNSLFHRFHFNNENGHSRPIRAFIVNRKNYGSDNTRNYNRIREAFTKLSPMNNWKDKLRKIFFLTASFMSDFLIQMDFFKNQTNKYFSQNIQFSQNRDQFSLFLLYSSQFQYKDFVMAFLGPKVLQFFYSSLNNPSSLSISILENHHSFYNLNDTNSPPKDFILSILQKRYLGQKNFILSKLFSSDTLLGRYENNFGSLKEPPGPPISEILMPAKKYEAFKLTEKDFIFKNSFSIYEKIHSHQKQRFLKKLYNQPIQLYFKSHVSYYKNSSAKTISQSFSNDFSTFVQSFKELGSLNSFSIGSPLLKNMSSSNYYYKTRFLMRHRFWLTNQWSNAQLPEHNMESTISSDVDWRSMYIQSIKSKKSSENNQKDYKIDFSDVEQYYNPRIRKWFLSHNMNNRELKANSLNKFNFENIFTYEMYYHFLMESFYKTYHYFDQNRELLDYFVFSYLLKGSILKLNSFFLLARFYKK